MNNSIKRFITILLSICIVLLALSFVILSNHECHGEDCEVCLHLSNLKKLIAVFSLSLVLYFVFAITASFPSKSVFANERRDTIVSQKVKISD